MGGRINRERHGLEKGEWEGLGEAEYVWVKNSKVRREDKMQRARVKKRGYDWMVIGFCCARKWIVMHGVEGAEWGERADDACVRRRILVHGHAFLCTEADRRAQPCIFVHGNRFSCTVCANWRISSGYAVE